MKQILLILNIVFLCSFLTNAQKTITKKEFESLVDYANCKYVMAFIGEKEVDNPNYNELVKASLDNFETIPNYRNISKLLEDNSDALELAKTIDKRKEEYESAQSNEELKQHLKAAKWKNTDLNSTSNDVINSINSRFPNKGSNDYKINELQKSLQNFKLIVLGAFILLFVLLVVFFFFLKKNLRKYKNKQVLESNGTEKKFVPEVVKPYNLTEKDINFIANKVLEQYLKIEKENQPKSTIKVTEPNETPKPISKYLKGKSGKIFNRAENTPDNSFFKLTNENDDTAQFEFFGNEAEALAKRIFSEDISIIISGSYQNAYSIKTIKPGKIKRVGEQWEVIESIQIKLI